MEGYVHFRKDRSERGSGRVALYVREQQECMELYPGPDKWAEGLQARTKRQANTGDAAVGV